MYMWIQAVEAQTNPRAVKWRRSIWLATRVAPDRSKTLDV